MNDAIDHGPSGPPSPVPGPPEQRSTGEVTSTGQWSALDDPDMKIAAPPPPADAWRIQKRSLKLGLELRHALGKPAGTTIDGVAYEATGIWRRLDLFAKQLADLKEDQGEKLDIALAFIKKAENVRERRVTTAGDIALSVVKGTAMLLVGAALTYLGFRPQPPAPPPPVVSAPR